MDKLVRTGLKINPNDTSTFDMQCVKLLTEHDRLIGSNSITADEDAAFATALATSLHWEGSKATSNKWKYEVDKLNATTVRALVEGARQQSTAVLDCLNKVQLWGLLPTNTSNTSTTKREGFQKRPRDEEAPTSNPEKSNNRDEGKDRAPPRVACVICTKVHRGTCFYKTRAEAEAANKKASNKRSEVSSYEESEYIASILSRRTSEDLVNMTVTNALSHDRESVRKPIQVLVDNGALHNDYVSEALAEWLVSKGVQGVAYSGTVKSGILAKNNYQIINKAILIQLQFTDDYGITRTLSLTAAVIPTQFDVIIGRPSIKKFKLAKYLPSQFADEQDWNRVPLPFQDREAGRRSQVLGATTMGKSNVNTLAHLPDSLQRWATASHELPHEYLNVATTRDAFTREAVEGLRDDQLEAMPSEYLALDGSKETAALPTSIHGSPSLQGKIKVILEKYADVFSKTVRKEAAKVTPFRLGRVDLEEWESPRNFMRAPRAMDNTRSNELKRQIEILLQYNIIRVSRQAYGSHPHMVPKSTPNTWRFCIDFKGINKACSTETWPIPNIKVMLYRLGGKRPKFYGVLDLTAGYHQTLIEEADRKYTAFITWVGTYEWNRLAMGLKSAGAYFQRVMSTEVLGGLLGTVCELYLDDMIICGSDEEEFLNNLDTVLARLQEFGIAVNPDKCKLGLSSVTYVGHTIDATGIHFERDRLDSVLAFPVPSTHHQMKKFIGFAGWFRDHVANHSMLMRPLQLLINDYKKSNKVIWTEEALTAFQEAKEAIHSCPKLFFIDDISPIILCTDASDYGIGGCLTQVVDGIAQPIAFMSKSLTGSQLNWDTPKKEGYAIFYSLSKWEYLLRDRHFKLKTDHKNLTQLKQEPLLTRW
jgi:hypothetical protein